MDIHISARQFALSDALKKYVHDKLFAHIAKYMHCATDCDVHFSRNNHQLQCQVVLRSGVKTTFVSSVVADDIYDSFDACLVKLDRQLVKQSSKLKDHQQSFDRNSIQAYS